MPDLSTRGNLSGPLNHQGVKAQALSHSQGVGESPLTPQQPVGWLQGSQVKLNAGVDEACV